MSNQSTSSIKPSPVLEGQTPYQVPSHPAPTDLQLAGNEGITPPEELLSSLDRLDPESLRSYPSSGELTKCIAELHNVDPERVLVTAGADDAMLAAFRAVLAPDRNIVVPIPTFVMVRRFAELTGAEVRSLEWDGAQYPLERVRERVDQQTSVVPVVSPNNPTGATASEDTLLRLSEDLPETLILLDHAYVEFADPQYNLTETAIQQDNVVVLRTFSKAWGLAGLRVGYAIGPEEVIRWMSMAKSPYAVSDLSLNLVRRRLELDRSDVDEFVASIRSERQELVSLLSELGARPQESQANFVLCTFDDVEWVFDALSGLGIATRIFPTHDLLDGKLRVTCPGEPSDFRRLKRAFRTILQPEAVLLDMDGVLADVSGSYRRTIQETASSYGVNVTLEEISDAKMEGDANNDWELTKKLLERQGTSVPLEDVTERFEQIYHGTGDHEGLYREETLLVEEEWLADLSDRFDVGIVTGRPRKDAERFLEMSGTEQYIDEMICMDDVESVKPDPEPVNTCLDRLDVEHAWFLGDTPDDMQAGRGAQVLPVGIVPPDEDLESVQEPLRKAGASRVIEQAEELTALLP